MASSATLQTPYAPQILQLPACLLACFYSAPLVEFYSALDTDTPVLEQNALRALFKTYRDLQSYTRFTLKIFLRTDIWSRLTADGFREASHITRTVIINWDRTSLLNLIIRRSLKNDDLTRFYEVDPQSIASIQQQEVLFYRMFPDQIDSGRNKPKTLEWILSRVQDGSRQPAPREVIHFLNISRDKQYRMIELGEPEPPSCKLFSRSALTEALPGVSKVRLEQTLYAEHREFSASVRDAI